MDQEQDLETKLLTPPARDPGSFRDPSGFVCHFDGSVFRAIDPECSARVRELESSGLLGKLQHLGALIPTRRVGSEERVYQTLHRHIPQVADFLHHEKVPFISYPYEWSTSMLVDAARCCLDLQLLLIQHGYSLKDASAYNVQFVKGRPVFIDVPSIETVRRRDVWTALDQFLRMFLFPLLLSRYRRFDQKGYFLAHLDGMTLDEVYQIFGPLSALRPGLLLDVMLPYHLQRFAAGDGKTLGIRVNKERSDSRAIAWNLRRLKSKIAALGRRSVADSEWVDYTLANTYTTNETKRKERFIIAFLEEHRIQRVLDLGCNTGRFTVLAAKGGASVVAVDADPACVDRLYCETRGKGWDITPLVVNIANPSPGIGFRNRERLSFTDRASFDCVLALALVHHLLVTSRLPLGSIVDLFADLTSSYLVVEFIERGDEMFTSLLAAREDIYGHVTRDRFLSEFSRRFDLISQENITEHRTMVSLEKRE